MNTRNVTKKCPRLDVTHHTTAIQCGEDRFLVWVLKRTTRTCIYDSHHKKVATEIRNRMEHL